MTNLIRYPCPEFILSDSSYRKGARVSVAVLDIPLLYKDFCSTPPPKFDQ